MGYIEVLFAELFHFTVIPLDKIYGELHYNRKMNFCSLKQQERVVQTCNIYL